MAIVAQVAARLGWGDAFAWTGPAALSLQPHALAPVAELPVLEVLSAVHILADLTLGLGRVVHDYLEGEAAPRLRQKHVAV